MFLTRSMPPGRTPSAHSLARPLPSGGPGTAEPAEVPGAATQGQAEFDEAPLEAQAPAHEPAGREPSPASPIYDYPPHPQAPAHEPPGSEPDSAASLVYGAGPADGQAAAETAEAPGEATPAWIVKVLLTQGQAVLDEKIEAMAKDLEASVAEIGGVDCEATSNLQEGIKHASASTQSRAVAHMGRALLTCQEKRRNSQAAFVKLHRQNMYSTHRHHHHHHYHHREASPLNPNPDPDPNPNPNPNPNTNPNPNQNPEPPGAAPAAELCATPGATGLRALHAAAALAAVPAALADGRRHPP